jgi:hypothetical protein
MAGKKAGLQPWRKREAKKQSSALQVSYMLLAQ